MPYSGTYNKIVQQALSKPPIFKEKAWQQCSPHVQDLIRQLMHIDPETRISISEALNHKWLEDFNGTMNQNKEMPDPLLGRAILKWTIECVLTIRKSDWPFVGRLLKIDKWVNGWINLIFRCFGMQSVTSLLYLVLISSLSAIALGVSVLGACYCLYQFLIFESYTLQFAINKIMCQLLSYLNNVSIR